MPQPLKPPAMKYGDSVRLLSLASPIKDSFFAQGCEELERLGLKPVFDQAQVLAQAGFFAGLPDARLAALKQALAEPETSAIFCTRGGYGSNYLLECLTGSVLQQRAKSILGCSDLSSLQIYLWEKFGWVTFYGPMVAMNFWRGPGAPHGYDRQSLLSALTEIAQGWTLELDADRCTAGEATGTLLGGCLTLVEATLGTPWELQTDGAILVLEDRGMKPYAIDRSLMHLKQAGKFRNVAGILLGDFPDSEVPVGEETVRDVVRRVLGSLGVPIVYGAPIGHTSRAMLTIPLGVRARLTANAQPRLEILEPACQ
jgi:muramoyltetrapeptide carboxypeptidase